MKKIIRFFVILIILILSSALAFLKFVLPKGSNFNQEKLRPSAEKKVEEPQRVQTKDVFKDNQVLNILLLGEDTTPTRDDPEGKYKGRTDTMMLCSLDPKEKKARILSVPRDSRVPIPGHKTQKINAAYAMGGVQLTAKTVEKFLDCKIDHYVIVNYNFIKELIDSLGGIEVYIPRDYKKRDDWVIPALVIDFKKGWQTLNGEDAVKYLRIRDIYPVPDIGRISAQQDFIMSIFDRLKSPRTIFALPKLLDIVDKNIKTDLNYGQIAYLGYWGLGINRENISTGTIDGYGKKLDDGVDYWIVDTEKARSKYREFFQEEKKLPSVTEELRVYRLGKDQDGTNPIQTKEQIEEKAKDRLKGKHN